MTLQDLITAVEGAEAGSRGLDCRVAVAMGWFRVEPRHTHNRKGGWIAPEDFMGVARDGTGPLYGQARRRRNEAISALMARELLSPLIGPTFARLTTAGRKALEAGRG